ncbi:MAG TPA: peptide deformylase [Patescibacteria group bacterium]|nr:peptide deformylase [Patescibacteria group bacterium]
MTKEIEDLFLRFGKILEGFPEVRYAGDPVLREPTQEVSVEEGVLLGKKLGEVLIRYRKTVGYGRGFAAPQIGENKSVFVTFVNDQLETFINPKIVKKSETTNFYRELCLSSGIMSADVERPDWIVMEYINEKGEKHKDKFDGFLARLYQHEEAHLRGIINLDEAAQGGIEFAVFDPLKEEIRTSRHMGVE